MLARKKFAYVLVLLWMLQFGGKSALNGQEHDFCTWMKLGMEYEVIPKWSLSSDLEWRTKGDVAEQDRLGWSADVEYEAVPFLKIGGGYEVHYRNRGEEDGWKFRHRYRLQATFSARVHRIKLSLRERFQQTWDDVENELRLRSRLKLAYDIPKCKLEPYVSVEMYNGLARGEKFDVTRMRYRTGVSVPLAKNWEAEAFYCRQVEEEKGKHVLGIECVYKF